MKRLAYLILLVLISGNVLANSPSKPKEYIAQPWDVQHYDIKVKCDKDGKKIEGTCTIHIDLKSAANDSNSFFFQLNKLKVNKVILKDKEVKYDYVEQAGDASYYSVPLAGIADRSCDIIIDYSGTPQNEGGKGKWGGIHFMGDLMFNMGVGFHSTNISSGSYWFPCYDHPSDKATYDIAFIVDNKYNVASSGVLQSIERYDDNHSVHKWKGTVPAATYMLGFAIGLLDTFSVESNTPNIVYAKKEHIASAKKCIGRLDNMIQCFNDYYGEYPFEKVGYAVTPIGSMEHQTMISLAQGVLSEDNSTTAAHELSHSWFGGSLTPYDFRDAWLNEGFATFSEAIWIEYINQTDNQDSLALLAFRKKIHNNCMRFTKQSPMSERLEPLYNFNSSLISNYPELIYNKGAAVLAILREELGDSLFFGAVREYVKTYSLANVSTANFRKVLEDYTKKDLTEYFDQWIYGKGYPQVELNVIRTDYPDGKFCKLEITSKQVQKAPMSQFTNYYIDFSFIEDNKFIADRKATFANGNNTVVLDSIPAYTIIRPNTGRAAVSLYEVRNIKTSVEESDIAEDSISLFPLISNSYINISVSDNNTQINDIVIYSEAGEAVQHLKFTNKVDISNLSAGVYFAKVGNRMLKFIKM